MSPPVELVLLWHLHQPDYREPGSGRALLPWVRLHATKDYLDMARRLAPYPRVRVTFNLVPILVDQLEAAAAGGADLLFEQLARPIASLTADERRHVADRCAQAPRHAIERWPAYRALVVGVAAGREPGESELLALEIWFLLGWLDPTLLGEPAAVRATTAADRFTVEHRDDLLALHARLVGEVLAAYRELEAAGRIEISTSPYCHPILPLLFDHRIARRARPDLGLPREPFAWPGDARLQLERALDRHERAFGRKPAGAWPSEGSVSPEVADLAASVGLRWIAADEGVLFRSLPEALRRREALYRPWKVKTPSGDVAVFFRDHELSDRIGFVYQRWDPADAVADFLERLRRIGREHGGDAPARVSVILDGENCWEGYADDGGPFLDRLYAELEAAPDILTRTPAGVLDSGVATPLLADLHSGSWIDADFHIWIGHPEKNRAWDLLARARQAYEAHASKPAAALDALLRAEGSDWFWWFGEDHYTRDKPLFDSLFRRHVLAVYEALAQPPPLALAVPVSRPGHVRSEEVPVAQFRPVLDGRVTHYYEWQAAGHVTSAQGGAMHSGSGIGSAIYYGFDRERFYLRVDFTAGEPPGPSHGLRLEWIEPPSLRLEVPSLAAGAPPVLRMDSGAKDAETVAGAECRIEQLLELAIPLGELGAAPGQAIECLVQILEAGHPVETLPAGDSIRILPEEALDTTVWMH